MLSCATFLYATKVAIVENRNSGIPNADHTATMSDGTILGFYNVDCLVGIISSNTSVTLPDTIFDQYNNMIEYSEISLWNEPLDLSRAPNLSELHLPYSITSFGAMLPAQIRTLYLNSTYMDTAWGRTFGNNIIPTTTTVIVPRYLYSYYTTTFPGVNYVCEDCDTPLNSYTINVDTPGSLFSIMYDTISSWLDVQELTIFGNIDSTDFVIFSNLTNLIKLDLSHTNITSISNLANLCNLEEVILPTTLRVINDKAFSNCRALTNVFAPNVVIIGDSALYNCQLLKFNDFPLLKQVGKYAFYKCFSIQNINVPQVEYLDIGAFYYCKNMVKFDCPSLLQMGREAFQGCMSIDTMILPHLTEIPHYAFFACESLKYVSVPNVTKINIGAFSECQNLQNIFMPKVTYIADDGLVGCWNLTDITLPEEIETISQYALTGYGVLRNVYCYAAIPICTGAFYEDIVYSTTLHVPAFALSSYMSHPDWNKFARIVPLDTLTDFLYVSSNLSLNSHIGLADTMNMTIATSGRLHLNTGVAFRLHNYKQTSIPVYDATYSNYSDCSSLITNDTITADSIELEIGLKKNCWNFLSFPFDVHIDDINVPQKASWIVRSYSGEDRANLTGNTWYNVTDGMTLNAYRGYIFNCTDGDTCNDFVNIIIKASNNPNKQNIFTTENATLNLETFESNLPHNSNWNIVGNPYPCFFNTDSLLHDGIITIWNGTGYSAYSLLDDNYCLRPFESFFVQCADSTNEMVFNKGGRTSEYEPQVMCSKSNMQFAFFGEMPRKVYNLFIRSDYGTDHTRFVFNELASKEYEIKCDASKFLSDNATVPQLYVLEKGQRFAIDERPFAEGKVDLGIYIAKPGQYTITLDNNPNENIIPILIDKMNGNRTNLAKGEYMFQATSGFFDERFTIVFEETPTSTQVIEEMKNYCERGDVYSIDGKFAKHIENRTELETLMPGVYVIRNGNIIEKVTIK